MVLNNAYAALKLGQMLALAEGYYLHTGVISDNIPGTTTRGVGAWYHNEVEGYAPASGENAVPMAYLAGTVFYNMGDGKDGLRYLDDIPAGTTTSYGGVEGVAFGSMGRNSMSCAPSALPPRTVIQSRSRCPRLCPMD